MKSAAVATFGLFAGLASATSPIRHLHFPRSNSTITAVDNAAPTTLTVFATSVHTVISCAATITNCPARANSTGLGSLPESARTTMVVTDTIVLATTICPVEQASSISSSLQAAHSSGLITGSTLKPTAPAVTPPPANAAGSSAAAATPGVSLSVTNVVTDKTLTMTIGKGTDASVITTTIQATTQETVTITSTLGNGETAPEPTTTTTATTTDTTYITVQPVQTAGGSSGTSTGGNGTPANGSPANGSPANGSPANGSPANGNAPPANGAPGSGSCAGAPTVTVTVAKETVTVPASTVFVTIAPSSCDSSSSSAVTGQAIDTGSNSGSNSGSSGSGSGSGSEGSGAGNNGAGNSVTSASTPCPSDITTTVRATVTVQPFPINNGTAPTGAASPSSSGFARLRR
ncbi:hypothetical protein ACHAQJ_000541 [Trichoderma viride]